MGKGGGPSTGRPRSAEAAPRARVRGSCCDGGSLKECPATRRPRPALTVAGRLRPAAARQQIIGQRRSECGRQGPGEPNSPVALRGPKCLQLCMQHWERGKMPTTLRMQHCERGEKRADILDLRKRRSAAPVPGRASEPNTIRGRDCPRRSGRACTARRPGFGGCIKDQRGQAEGGDRAPAANKFIQIPRSYRNVCSSVYCFIRYLWSQRHSITVRTAGAIDHGGDRLRK